MAEKKAPGKFARAEGGRESAAGASKPAAKRAAPRADREGGRESAAGASKPAAKRAAPRADREDGEGAVLANIAAMPEPDRTLAGRLHALVRASAPALAPRLWYGMPAYARDGKVVCFFQS